MQERIWHRNYDQAVPPGIDYEELSIVEFLQRSSARFPERTAIVFKGSQISYRELQDDVERFAAALANLGVGRDSRVAIQMPNMPQTVIAFYAVLRLGAQAVMTNPLYTPREFEHQWHDAGVDVVVLTDFLWMNKVRAERHKLDVKHFIVATIADALPIPARWIAPFLLRRKGLAAKVPSEAGVHSFAKLLKGRHKAPGAAKLDLDHVAILQYTGGTTGVSKGAMLSHRNLSANVQQVATWFTCFEEGAEQMLTSLPLFHVFGLTVAMNWPLMAGATLVLMPDPRNVGDMVDAIERHAVTILPAVPAMFNGINNFKGIAERDLSSIKACFSGSAPLPQDTLTRFEELTGARILEGFGLTETSPVTHVNPLEGERKLGSIGMPLPDTDARLVERDDPTREVAPGEQGELLIRGPQVMLGYWNQAEASSDSLLDGWLRTGDLASVDEDGYFRIVGRVKDMIIAGGYNIYPDEIDDVLASHPGLLEAATIGIPDPRRGETVKSFVVAMPNSSAKPPAIEELQAWCRERLAAYKVPREFEYLDELPKSSVLKVLRRELRDMELARRSTESK